jgi:hypothetical protein
MVHSFVIILPLHCMVPVMLFAWVNILYLCFKYSHIHDFSSNVVVFCVSLILNIQIYFSDNFWMTLR